jgi:hypothetical protein
VKETELALVFRIGKELDYEKFGNIMYRGPDLCPQGST